jgi:glycogen debranching enzyme
MLGSYSRKQNKVIEEGYSKAKAILKECISEIGFKASALDNGYNEVWGRDSMITLLGAMTCDDKDLTSASLRSLETLRKYQTELGLIPNNVDVSSKEAQFRAYMDGTLWYIIGVWFYFKKTKNIEFLNDYIESVDLAVEWLNHQDVDNSAMISTQEAGDWMDLFPVRGKVLYDNVLYFKCLRVVAFLHEALNNKERASLLIKRADDVLVSTHRTLWVNEAHAKMRQRLEELAGRVKNDRFLEDELIRLSKGCVNIIWRPYFLSFYGFREYGDWFDSLGNILAILFDVADSQQVDIILDNIHGAGIDSPYPIKAIYPPVYPGDREWRDYFKVGNLNLPEQYHNGGIWPFVGGLYIASLVKSKRISNAKAQLEMLAQSNKKGKKYEWEFNEWLHGGTGNPMGKEKQAWSAAMYLFAYKCVMEEKVDLL